MGQDQHGKPWVHPAACDDKPELAAAAAAGNGCHLSGAACILALASLVPSARHRTCASVPTWCPCKTLQPCGSSGPHPGAGNKPISQGYWANWEGGARPPPPPLVMQGQSRMERTQPSPRMGMGMGMEGGQVGWG